MRKNIWLIAVGCVAIIALAGVYLWQQKSSTDSYSAQASEPSGHGVVGNAQLDTDPFDVTITYTDEGYVPTEITIEQGQRVRFLNASTKGTWPASALHPTHTLYPERESSDCLGSSFDACKELLPGEFFDYTFYYPGQWRFHDHVNPYHTGAITVSESAADSTAQ